MATTIRDSQVPGSDQTGRTDQFVSGLDQAYVRHGRETWWIRVLGVHDDGCDLWVQIARTKNPVDDLTLRVSPGATAQDALDAVSALRTAGTYARIVRVAPHASSHEPPARTGRVVPIRPSQPHA
jgi:hypothetical protein